MSYQFTNVSGATVTQHVPGYNNDVWAISETRSVPDSLLPFFRSAVGVFSESAGGGNAAPGVTVDMLTGIPFFAYGHSYLAADTVNTPATRYVSRWATKRAMALTNGAVSGQTMMDFAGHVIGTSGTYPVNQRGIVLVDGPINDATRITPDPKQSDPQAGFYQSLQALLFRLMTLSLVEETDASYTYTGTWSAATTNVAYSGGNLRRTGTQNDQVSIATSSGTDFALLMWAVYNSTTGNASITVDGSLLTNVNNPRCGTSPNSSSIVAPVIVPITRLNAGSHTIVVKKTDAAANLIYVDALFKLNPTPPLIVVNKGGYITQAGYNSQSGGTALGSDATVDVYNALIDAAVVSVRTAYPAARIVVTDPNANGWDKISMVGSDGIHPNDKGEAFMLNLIDSAVLSYMSSNGWQTGIQMV